MSDMIYYVALHVLIGWLGIVIGLELLITLSQVLLLGFVCQSAKWNKF